MARPSGVHASPAILVLSGSNRLAAIDVIQVKVAGAGGGQANERKPPAVGRKYRVRVTTNPCARPRELALLPVLLRNQDNDRWLPLSYGQGFTIRSPG